MRTVCAEFTLMYGEFVLYQKVGAETRNRSRTTLIHPPHATLRLPWRAGGPGPNESKGDMLAVCRLSLFVRWQFDSVHISP